MSTAAYLIAHRALPLQAGSQPEELWRALSGPDWSSWLAMVGMTLKITVRKIGVEGAPLGKAVIARDGFELLAMYFPAPEASGEPYFAILARRAGETAPLRSFVFERGVTTPEEPVRVVMAEWTFRDAQNGQRMRFDATADASLAACLARVVAVMKDAPPAEPAAPAGPVALDRKKLIPRLRHARWKGWDELPSRPLLDLPVANMVRVTCGVDTRETFRFVQHADLEGGTTLAALEAIAVANLAKRSEFWTVAEKSKGVFGLGKKPTRLELVAEHASWRILDPQFLGKAHEQLGAELLAVALPFRGVLWARAGTGPDVAAFVQQVRAAFAGVPRGVEPLSPHVFTVMAGKVTGLVTGPGDPAADVEAPPGFPSDDRTSS